MLEFLFRLVIETAKFLLRIFMILGGALLPAMGNAALAFFRNGDEPKDEVFITSGRDAELAFAEGKIDAFQLRAYRDMYGD